MENEKELDNVVEEQEEEEAGFALTFLATGKWKKFQTISLLDFRSLEGTLSTLKGIALIVLLVQYIKLRKKTK